jgi:hypothetical protein
MLVKFEEEDKKKEPTPLVDIDDISIKAGHIESELMKEEEKEKYKPTEEELKKLEEILLNKEIKIELSNTPQNASEMMITTNEDIINSVPSDDEISDWDSTLMDGLEEEEFELVKPSEDGPKINRLSYVKRNG